MSDDRTDGRTGEDEIDLTVLPLEPPHVSLSLLLPRDAASIPLVRHMCEFALRELGCMGTCADDVGLAVTEACANVVQHAAPGDCYTIEVSIQRDICEMRVVDRGGNYDAIDAAASVAARSKDVMSESGRGIAIIDALMDHLSFESRPETGTLVRMVKQLEFDPDSTARKLLAATS